MARLGRFPTRWRVRLGYPVAVLYLLLATPKPRFIAWGAGIGIAGLLIRGAAAGHLRKHEALATSGPYAMTRNPLYLGSAVLAAGFLVAGDSWWAALVVATYFLAFYPAVMKREESELRARYSSAFEEYAARVSVFWPNFRRFRATDQTGERFSWALYVRNREYEALVGFLVGLALVWLRMVWHW